MRITIEADHGEAGLAAADRLARTIKSTVKGAEVFLVHRMRPIEEDDSVPADGRYVAPDHDCA